MQQPNRPAYGPNTLFDPTRLLADRIARLGITLPEVLAILPSATTQTADTPNKLWHIGEVRGRRFRVLVDHRTAEYARIVTIRQLV